MFLTFLPAPICLRTSEMKFGREKDDGDDIDCDDDDDCDYDDDDDCDDDDHEKSNNSNNDK